MFAGLFSNVFGNSTFISFLKPKLLKSWFCSILLPLFLTHTYKNFQPLCSKFTLKPYVCDGKFLDSKLQIFVLISRVTMSADKLVMCYNKGCGLKFDPALNKEDSCTFHPGAPIFHDAYKSWSCCKKKSTDFTEFLNYKGCATSFHNPDKPVEEKPLVDKSTADEVVEYRPPVRQSLDRPSFDSPLTLIEPKVGKILLETASITKFIY